MNRVKDPGIGPQIGKCVAEQRWARIMRRRNIGVKLVGGWQRMSVCVDEAEKRTFRRAGW